MNTMSDIITCMIHVFIPANIDSLIQCFRCIIRGFFLNVNIKLESLGLLVDTFQSLILHIHVGKVYNKPILSMIIKICKYVEELV